KFLDRVFVRYRVIAELTHPHKTKLLATFLNFTKSLVDEKGIHNTGTQKTALVLFNVAGDFSISGNEFSWSPFELTALRVDDTALPGGSVKIAYKLFKVSRYSVPLPELAAFSRTV